MGSKTNFSSKRTRNRKQKRRLRQGLIIGSVVAFLALFLLIVNAYRSYPERRAQALAKAYHEGLYEGPVTEASYEEYDMPYLGDPAGGTTYTITGAVSEAGRGSVTPSSVTVSDGGSVTLTATPNPGYVFSHWVKGNSTAVFSTNSKLILKEVKETVTYKAVFDLAGVQVTYANNPEHGGTITCTQTFVPYSGPNAGDKAEFSAQAIPYEGYTFKNWEVKTVTESGTTSTDTSKTANPATFTFTRASGASPVASVSIKAVYQQKKTGHLITLSVVSQGFGGLGEGTTTAGDMPGSVSNVYQIVTNANYSLLLVAQCSVDHFPGVKIYDDDTGTEASSTMIDINTGTTVGEGDFSARQINIHGGSINKNKHFIIRMDGSNAFENSITTVAYPPEGGTTSGDVGTQSTQQAISTTLNATANEGYMFDRWEYYEDGKLVVSKTATLPVSVKGHKVFVAYFVPDMYEIKGISDPSAGGTINGIGKYNAHSDATLVAVPTYGYVFDKWTWKTADGDPRESTESPLQIRDVHDDYTVTAHFSKKNPVVSVAVNPLGTSTTGSRHNYVKITGGSTEETTDATAGTASMTIANGTTVTLQAVPNEDEDYAFAYWVDQNGQTSSSNPFSIGDIKDDLSYIAVFTKKQDQYEVKGVADPTGSGTFTFNVTNPTASFTDSGLVEPHADISVTPNPATGYAFDKWTWKTADGIEHESRANPLNISNIMENYTLIGHFYKANPQVTVTVSPLGKVGSLYNYARMTDGSNSANFVETDGTTGTGTITVSGGSSLMLQATANDDEGYEFSAWVDSDGNVSTSNPYALPRITDDMSVYAVFTKKEDQYEVKAYADPDGVGLFQFSVENPDGSTDSFTDAGRVVPHANIMVYPASTSSNYIFDSWSWKTKDGTERTSRQNPLRIENITSDTTLIGHYDKATPRVTVHVDPLGARGGNYNYVEMTDSAGGASSTGSSGTGYLDATGGSVVTLKAVPNKQNLSEFAYWVDDEGNTSSANPYIVGKISDDKTFYAVFTSKDDDDITVLASPPSGGRVTCEKTSAGGYTITASANRGYTFKYWKCADTGTIIRSKSYTMDAAEGAHHYTYIAYFDGDKNAKFTSDIVNEYFPNIRRLFKDPVYRYTRESWTASVSAFINSIRGNYPKASGTPKNYAAYATVEEAVNTKVSQQGRIEITAHSELITTDNEVIPVTSVADQDSAMDRAIAITADKFGDRYTPEVICVRDVSVPNGFVDGVRTYLWYDTGVQKGDNLFIIYEMNGQERIVTPIANYEGTLRFTIDKLGAVNRFALVRVTVE